MFVRTALVSTFPCLITLLAVALAEGEGPILSGKADWLWAKPHQEKRSAPKPANRGREAWGPTDSLLLPSINFNIPPGELAWKSCKAYLTWCNVWIT